MTDETPPDSKLTRSKQRWASEHKFITGEANRSAHERLPPGQHLVRDWPVLDLGRQPDIAPERWELKIGGLVDNPVTLDWKAFMALPQTRTRSDMHCVTTWSRYDNDWKGIDFLAADQAGFWEVNGYHMRGDPWTEERYS